VAAAVLVRVKVDIEIMPAGKIMGSAAKSSALPIQSDPATYAARSNGLPCIGNPDRGKSQGGFIGMDSAVLAEKEWSGRTLRMALIVAVCVLTTKSCGEPKI
jgi:hypothetical protein